MHDELNALRRVYGEAAEAPPLDAGAETEAAQLAELKAVLDALPPQRPDVAVLEAVVAAAVEASRAALGPVRSVYDEEAVPLATPEARAEAAQLAEVKAALDALPPQRPAPALLDAVVAAAAASSAPRSRPAPVAATAGRAAERPARQGSRRKSRSGAVAALGVAFTLVLALGIGLWPGDASPPEIAGADQSEEASAVAQEKAAPTEAPLAAADPADEAGAAALSPAPSSRNAPSAALPAPVAGFQAAAARRVAGPAPAESALARGTAPGPETLDAAALPLADGDEELQLLYLRLQEMQAGQVGVEWDGPAVSLGAAPDSIPAAHSGWMQVRVQR